MQARSALIMVVDDEKHIATAAAMFLRRAGYQTIVAQSAAEALRAWDDQTDLLLTDWSMPDLFGDELAARLRERKPGLKVLMMSGNPLASIESNIPLTDGVNFLAKPFHGQELVDRVKQALGDEVRLGCERPPA